MARCAFIGLGIMGYPMAGHLVAAGHQVRVFNRTGEKAKRWLAQYLAQEGEQYNAQLAATPKEAVAQSEVVFVCVGDDPDVRAVMDGPGGVLAGLKAGAMVVDHSTTSAKLARELCGKVRDAGGGFLDAPVSGGQSGAEQGILTVMCGGDPADFAKVEPLMACYGKAVTLIGPVGSGQLTKMVNQICIAGLIQGLSKGLNFGRRAGLDMERVVSVISQGAAQSWQMDHRATTMLSGEFNFGFPVEWMRKDLRISLEEAREQGAALPIAALVDQFYQRIVEAGGARWDTSSLIRLLGSGDVDG